MSTLIAYASLVSTPWKNAGGSTAEIAVSPPGAGFDDFDWRLSLATIRAAGPFSVFPGVERTLALVDGPGLILDIDSDSDIDSNHDGRRRVVLGGDEAVIAFPGEAAVSASLDGGIATDFNVMTRRARCHHRVGRRSVAGVAHFAPRADVSILFLAEGEALSVCGDGERLGLVRYDAVMLDGRDGAAAWTLEAGQATLLVVEIFFH